MCEEVETHQRQDSLKRTFIGYWVLKQTYFQTIEHYMYNMYTYIMFLYTENPYVDVYLMC